MPNHVHLIISNTPDPSLSTIMRDLKRHTSTKIGNELEKANERAFLYIFKKAAEKSVSKVRWKIWQDEFHPEAIYSEEWFYKKLEYMHNNPVRKGFVVHPEDWKYSSARNWILEDDSIIKLNREVLNGQMSKYSVRSG